MAENKVEKIIEELDYDTINQMISVTGNKDLGQVKKQTLKNISRWALNGASDKEIRNNLELSDKQFRVLCSLCPAVLMIMQQSREYADIVLASSLFQRAIGGQRVHKMQAQKVGDFDATGKKIGEHLETIEVWEELPPDANLLKFLAEHKLNEKFGEKMVDEDTEARRVVENLTEEQIKQLESEMSK